MEKSTQLRHAFGVGRGVGTDGFDQKGIVDFARDKGVIDTKAFFNRSDEWQSAYLGALAACMAAVAKTNETTGSVGNIAGILSGFRAISDAVFCAGAENESRGCGDVHGRFDAGFVAGSAGGGRDSAGAGLSGGKLHRGCNRVDPVAPLECDAGFGGGVRSGAGCRGPNYEKNQEARMRKKVKKQERIIAEAEARGRLAVYAGGFRGKVERTDAEQKLHDLKVERQIMQEERKLNKLKSPAQMVEDAIHQIEFAERCAKRANDSKVAAWAAAISTASAESIARSTESFEKVVTVPTVSTASETPVADVAVGEAVVEALARPGNVPADLTGWGDAPGSRSVAGTSSVDSSGRSLKADGTPYTYAEAVNWVNRQEHINKHYTVDRPKDLVRRMAKCSVDVIDKYYRLREQVENARRVGNVPNGLHGKVGENKGNVGVGSASWAAKRPNETGQQHFLRVKNAGLLYRK